MDERRISELMEEAILEARKAKHEDERPHPLVGAILADEDGKIILRAHRGENNDGGHAEYTLIKKADDAKVDLRNKTLFVTLEPCTRRGVGKVPCAVRVVESQIRRVFIGMLDPNPAIAGRGELFLFTRGVEVERFPYSLMKRLFEMNESFVNEHLHYVAPVVEASSTTVLTGNREALLQASLDLMVASDGPIWIFSGESSWVRELQVGLLYASMKRRQIRVLCASPDQSEKFEMRMSAAKGAGAEVGISRSRLGIRGTLVSPASDATMISIERQPTLHGLKLSMPHEAGVLSGMIQLFENEWANCPQINTAQQPIVHELDLPFVESTLRKRIPAYRQASFEMTTVQVSELLLISKSIERFKLYRIGLLEELRKAHGLPEMGFIQGSTWPYLLPLIEITPTGQQVVIDGAHRVFYALQRNIKELRAILIRGVQQPLPSAPLRDLDEVKVTSEKWTRTQRYVDFHPEYFRPIREAFEDELWQMIRPTQSR
jgi:pyrimidine deaminase RibD-like protein